MPHTPEHRDEARRGRNGNDHERQGFRSMYDRDRGERDRGMERDRDRDRDRPDRDRGAWDDHARYMELAPEDGDRWAQRDDYERFDEGRPMSGRDHDGRMARPYEDDRRRGAGYGADRGYGGGQSGYGAGYSPPRGRGEGSMTTGYGQGAGGAMGYGSLGSGADTGPGSMGRDGQMGGRGGDWQAEGERDLGRSGQRTSHRGKGPVGYARSDERIKEHVCEVLTDDHDIDASSIEITVKNGEVTLSGHVPDRRTKRLAEDRIEGLSGVKDVSNNLKCSPADKKSDTNAKESETHAEAARRRS